ncbi:MAG: hypothetical protein ABI042_05750 [Verrucomicrobiota bacterium]
MKTDPILEEIRRQRDEHAKQFNYDLAAICDDHRRFAAGLKTQGWKFAKLPRRRRAIQKAA